MYIFLYTHIYARTIFKNSRLFLMIFFFFLINFILKVEHIVERKVANFLRCPGIYNIYIYVYTCFFSYFFYITYKHAENEREREREKCNE